MGRSRGDRCPGPGVQIGRHFKVSGVVASRCEDGSAIHRDDRDVVLGLEHDRSVGRHCNARAADRHACFW